MQIKGVKMKIKPSDELCHAVYNYLLEKAYGRENAIEPDVLASFFHCSTRTIRAVRETINSSSDFQRLISTSGATYMCSTEAECLEALDDTYKKGITLIKKAKMMSHKVKLNGQVKIDCDAKYDEIVRVFE